MLLGMKVFGCCSALEIALVGAVSFDSEMGFEMVKRKAIALEFFLILSPSALEIALVGAVSFYSEIGSKMVKRKAIALEFLL